MIQTIVTCDFCDQPIPVVLNDFGDPEEEPVQCIELSRTKEWDTRSLFPHLCKNCASKLDKAFTYMKTGIDHGQEILARNKKINEERRKRLNTNG